MVVVGAVVTVSMQTSSSGGGTPLTPEASNALAALSEGQDIVLFCPIADPGVPAHPDSKGNWLGAIEGENARIVSKDTDGGTVEILLERWQERPIRVGPGDLHCLHPRQG